MAPVQNTFSIIPNFPSAVNNDDDSATKASRRPMTTKQAKKAYQKANRGPKLSKAEQRRQDLLEQDRIRKEAEKERNQARARAARDRKKEKEDNERADKKKKGLPLVNVRPSQDTIARFVRGFGPPKTKPQQLETPAPVCSPVREASEVIGTCNNSCSPPSSPVSSAEGRRSDRNPEDEPSSKRLRVGDSISASLDSNHGRADYPVVPTPERCSRSLPPELQQVSQRVEARSNQPPTSGTSSAAKDTTTSPMPPPTRRDTMSDPMHPIHSKPVSQATQGALTDERSPKRTPPEPVASITAPISFSQEFRDIAAILDDDSLNDSFGSIFASPRDKGKASGPTQSSTLESSQQPAPALSTERHPVIGPEEGNPANNDQQPAPNPSKSVQTLFNAKCQPNLPLVDKKIEPSFRQPLRPLSATRVNAKSQVQFLGRNPRPQHKPIKLQTDTDHPQKPPGLLSVTPMGPPPIPLNTQRGRYEGKHAQLSSPGANKASPNLSRQEQVPEEPGSRGTKAPSSTQAFVFSHVDDLFPSPSQEIEELFAVDKGHNRKAVNAPRFLKTSRVAKHHAPPRFLARAQAGLPKAPTQQTPQRKAGAQQSRESQNEVLKEPPDLRPVNHSISNLAHCQVPAIVEYLDFPFLSTQDVFLSSQDVQEMGTPTNSSRQNRSADLLPSSSSQRSATPTPAFRSRMRNTQRRHEHAICSEKQPTGLTPPQGVTPEIRTTQESPEIMGSSRAPGRVSEHNGMAFEDKNTDDSKMLLPAKWSQPSTATNPACGERHLSRCSNLVEQSTVAPRALAQPFFTSSCRAPLYKYAIERNKTSAWADTGSKKDSEAGLDLLQQLENERFINLLDNSEPFPFEEDEHTLAALIAQTDQQSSSPRKVEQDQEETPRQNVTNVLNLPTDNPHSSTRPVAGRADLPPSSAAPQPQQKRPLNSYQKMLAELDKSQQNKNMPEANTGEAAKPSMAQDNSELELQPLEPCGSQETDYGDIGWDDEMLFMM